MKIHVFATTGEAYDACQCDETVLKGDVLLIGPEKVVGVADTWPVSVTTYNGNLHHMASLEYLKKAPLVIREGYDLAYEIACNLDYDIFDLR